MTRSNPDPLERALETLLLPIVRLFLKRGVAFGRFAEIVKRAYVEAARRDFEVPGRKLSISRVSVLTGMTRKEASRLMQAGSEIDDGLDLRRQINRAARVVTAWVEDERFQDRRGQPASLPFESDGSPSFSQLVAEHGADVTPRAVLDELVRVGAVGERADGRLYLIERAYIPALDDEAKLAILGTDVADLVSSIEHNLEPDRREPFFQRKVAYDNLPAESLPALKRILADKGQALLEELNEEMARSDRGEATAEHAEDRRRAMIGIYYFEDREDDEN